MIVIKLVLGSLGLMAIANSQVHISPEGDDGNPGTAEKPLATMARAVAMVTGKGTPQTIVLHEGTYREALMLKDGKAPPSLLITAAPGKDGGYERAILEQGHTIKDAEAVDGASGVYRVRSPETFNSYRCRRSMWEADSRVRYRRVADVRAVAAYPASYRFEDDGYLYFHTSDDRPPKEDEIGYQISDCGWSIWWDNVTVRGLEFRNGNGLGVVGRNDTIEDCRAWNIDRIAFYVSALAKDAKVLRCTGHDLGAGVKNEGTNTTVEGCRFFRKHDAFESHLVTQDAAGIQFYHPARRGLIRDNLTVGFRLGVFCKGTREPILVESNTSVNGSSYGIGFVHWRPGSVVRNNIASGHHAPYIISGFLSYGRSGRFRDNLLWDAQNWEEVRHCFTIPQSVGSGQGVIMADPRFAAPKQDDFRLLPDSPALRGKRTLGAFGRVPDNWKDTQPPNLVLTADKPAVILGQKVELYFERDHWQPGGGTMELRETTFESHAGNTWLVPEPEVKLLLTANDNATAAVEMKLRVGEGAWGGPQPFAAEVEAAMPEGQTEVVYSVQVSDEAGNWSEPAMLRAFNVTQTPELLDKPTVYVNRHGFVVAFRSKAPCTAKLEWGETADYGQAADRPAEVIQRWSAGDGGEWTEKRTGPRQDHQLAVLSPRVAAGKTYHYRLVLDDGVGHVTRTEDAVITIERPPRTIHLSPSGKDIEGAGAEGAPWRSLQFAVDRALPGDRILLSDGIYIEPAQMLRGGIEGAPLTIEAANRWGAVLDGGKRQRRLLTLHEAPYVVLRGLEVRWFEWCGMQITHSPNVALENCAFWNNHLVKGRRSGSGFYARRSPGLTLRGNVLYYMNEGFCLVDCPRFHLEQNTAVSMLHRGCRLVFSTRDSTFVNNCFTFTGNDHLQACESAADWETFTCDYNNFAAKVRSVAPRRPAPEVDIKPWGGNHWAKQSKGVNNLRLMGEGGKQLHCFSLAEWQEKTGKDQHSIYKRPLYVDPFKRNWHLQPDSPNIGAGKDGSTIGALGVAGPKE